MNPYTGVYITFQLWLYFMITLPLVLSTELYSSIAHLSRALQGQKELRNNLQAYVAAKQTQLDGIKNEIKSKEQTWDSWNPGTSEISTSSILTPFVLTTVVLGYKQLLKFTKRPKVPTIEAVENHEKFLADHKEYFPDSEDLNGAIHAILRLQYVYGLETERLVQGMGQRLLGSISANDCFDIGKKAYADDKYEQASSWFKQALLKLNNDTNDIKDFQTLKFSIYEFNAYSFYRQGNLYGALRHTQELLNLDSNHSTAQQNAEWYENELKRHIAENPEYLIEQKAKFVNWGHYIRIPDRASYFGLCTDRIEQKHRKKSCKILDYKHPMLKYERYQYEILHKRPRIVIFYNVLTNSEICQLINLSLKQLKRATVVNPQNYSDKIVEERVSKRSWHNNDHPLMNQLNKRITLLTGMNAEKSEILQIGNYGIGGHYDPHYDFSNDPKSPISARLATFMFYLSDVEQGGGTIFPKLGLRIKPQKGAAVFWYNIHVNGSGDLATMHGACPVLHGSKWVANKWLRTYSYKCNDDCSHRK